MDIFKKYVRHFLYDSEPASDSATLSDDFRCLYLSRIWRLNEPARFIDYGSTPSGHHDGPMNICPSESVSGIPVHTERAVPDGRPFTGIIRGLSPIGQLQVEDITTGQLKEFAFKEIGYIL